MTTHVGDLKELKAEFKVDDVLTDPTAISLEVNDPSGNTATYTYAGGEITKDATGTYSKQIELDESGWWEYEWQGTGSVVAVEGGKFFVKPQRIT